MGDQHVRRGSQFLRGYRRVNVGDFYTPACAALRGECHPVMRHRSLPFMFGLLVYGVLVVVSKEGDPGSPVLRAS